MQRIEVSFNKDEYIILRKLFGGEFDKDKKLIKTIKVLDDKELDSVDLIFEAEKDNKVLLKIVAEDYLVYKNNFLKKEILFSDLTELKVILKLEKKEKKGEDILLKFDLNYPITEICNKNDNIIYYKNEYEKIRNEMDYVSSICNFSSESPLNMIAYADFSKRENLFIIFSWYFYRSRLNSLSSTEKEEELIKLKLEAVGYERDVNLKKNKDYFKEDFQERIRSCKDEEKQDLYFDGLVELFYKVCFSEIVPTSETISICNNVISDYFKYK